MSRFPFPATFTGWYQVAYSDELPVRAVLPLAVFGQELVLFRDEQGVAHVLDAHCPHLGAHLGYGGEVVGAALRCPFHGWCFDRAGACVSVPYAEKIPPRARLRAWPVREGSGVLFVWYDASGATPSWEPPTVVEYGRPDFGGYVQRGWTIRTHILEPAENIIDAAHFRSVHGSVSHPTTTVESDGLHFRSASSFQAATPRGPIEMCIDATAYGVALWILRFTGIVETVALLGLTPLDGERIRMRLSFLVSTANGEGPDHGVGAAVVADICKQVDQDVPIWEHKVYRERPLLCAGEQALSALRSWARQFYGSNPTSH